MFSAQALGIANTENALHIIPALVVGATCLRLIVTMALNAVAQHLNAKFARYAIG